MTDDSKKNSGQALWQRAKRVILGGNMLLSKRPDLHLPEAWPAYYSRARGCRVWDLDGREFCDMSLMGVGTNILGYAHAEVDEVVRQTLSSGNMSTLNGPEDVLLAERLIDLHPWADMARFARSGGEANAIAIRIARAASGRDVVAVCGYHGWHDWYLSANLKADNLRKNFLSGLSPRGVPQALHGLTKTFRYKDYDELQRIVDEHPVGVIKMEVARSEEPDRNFLQAVRDLATQSGAVLVFDECTSGFRQSFGGLHKTCGVEPDLAVFGKALGNGYAITAVIGRREVMEAAGDSFISSTFWTERIGPAAALKTLEVMERLNSWQLICSAGRQMREGWQKLATRHGLDIECAGISALPNFRFCSDRALAYKTYLTQHMLDQGYLAGVAFYPCIDHQAELIDAYLGHLDGVFQLISECERGRRNIDELLRGPVCSEGFTRLN